MMYIGSACLALDGRDRVALILDSQYYQTHLKKKRERPDAPGFEPGYPTDAKHTAPCQWTGTGHARRRRPRIAFRAWAPCRWATRP